MLQKLKSFYGNNFAPKLYEILKQGYTKDLFKKDALSGLTLAIISIPLAMALAIASGVSPANGMYTAVVAGFFIAVFGGSRYQIGGPTGAFAVIVFNTIQQHGYDGLLTAMIIAGLLLIVAGFLKLGTYIKYIPYPVIVGFTSGIAAILFTSQIKDLLGLQIDKMPIEFLPKWRTYFANITHLSISAVIISAISFLLITGLKIKKPKLPGYLIAVVSTMLIVVVFKLDIDTIGSKFGGIPRFLPTPKSPDFDIDIILKVFPSAITIAFLAGVESLLSATIADAMSGENHNSNSELIGEGIANIACGFFAGMPATGAIARTAANYKSGAHSPMSGVMQSLFLLVFMLLLSPAAQFIPLACLAAILVLIAVGMFDFPKFFELLIGQRGDRLTLIVTFLLTVFVDLNVAISVGFIMSSVIFMHRISQEIHTENLVEYSNKGRDINENLHNRGVMSIRISGPMFFGGASKISSFFKSINATPKVLIIRMGSVPMVDISGINVLLDFVKKVRKHNTKIIFSHLQPQPNEVLSEALKRKRLNKNITFASDFEIAVKMAERSLNNMEKREGLCQLSAL